VKIRVGFAMVVITTATAVGIALAQGSGADTYKANCASCHAADGTANSPAGKMMKINSFKSPDSIKKTNAELTATINNGVSPMRGFAGKLTDAQIKDLVAYIRTLQK